MYFKDNPSNGVLDKTHWSKYHGKTWIKLNNPMKLPCTWLNHLYV